MSTLKRYFIGEGILVLAAAVVALGGCTTTTSTNWDRKESPADAAKYKATTVGVRPEHLDITPNGAWNGKVVYSENLGSDSYIYVDIGAEQPVIVRQEGKSNFHAGDALSFSPKGEQFHRFDDAGRPLTH